jgi:CBS domain-containing protein
MRVETGMMRTAAYCTPETNLGTAAEVMWNFDCGMLPVVGAGGKVLGVITDRDMFIALATRNKTAGEINVGEVFAGRAYTCRPQDDIRAALDMMSRQKVRRLPVVNSDGVLQGILSMDDIVLHVETFNGSATGGISSREIITAMLGIYGRQLPQVVAAKVASAA